MEAVAHIEREIPVSAQRWIRLAVAALALGACETNSTVMTGPTVEHLWHGPDVIAEPEEITLLADLTVDPVVLEASFTTGNNQAAKVLESFGAGILDDPGPSFLTLELSLGSLYGTSTVPSAGSTPDVDAALVHEMLDLYRDHAAMTLFGVDRDALGPLTQPNGL